MLKTGYQYDDGGRSGAGYKGLTYDCVTRAISIATDLGYQHVYDSLNEIISLERKKRLTAGKKSRYKKGTGSRTGVPDVVFGIFLNRLGWIKYSTSGGFGAVASARFNTFRFPRGRVIVGVRGHLCTVIDGVLRDTFDSSITHDYVTGKEVKDGRVIYSYWLHEK